MCSHYDWLERAAGKTAGCMCQCLHKANNLTSRNKPKWNSYYILIRSSSVRKTTQGNFSSTTEPKPSLLPFLNYLLLVNVPSWKVYNNDFHVCGACRTHVSHQGKCQYSFLSSTAERHKEACRAAEVILMYKKVLSYQTRAGFEVDKTGEVWPEGETHLVPTTQLLERAPSIQKLRHLNTELPNPLPSRGHDTPLPTLPPNKL